MASAFEIRKHLERLLARETSLDDFEEWFGPYSWNIHKSGDSEAQRLAYAIEHQLSLFDEDSEDLRRALLAVLESAKIEATSPPA